MILIALGSNISGPWGSPEQSVQHAMQALNRDGLKLVAASRLLLTAPFGKPNQPPFVNAVARIATHLPPLALLQKLHAIERTAGRRRATRWGPRTLDLDIVDYHGLIRSSGKLILPHPGIPERIFVLKPIAELVEEWRHPESYLSAQEMLRRLKGYSQGQEV
ncbi:MAG TPA: 2-amino-4-hydroxy-6-hydroxymethyldihydropteridine diphosphokinase [Aestuariivirga sp.]